ncbi:MAG: hypothetical protein WAM82_10645 [Thermoanaerobaculia bacterium]
MDRRVAFVILLLLSSSLPRLAAAATWTRIGPEGGNVVVLAAAPSSPSTVYAGLSSGGVFRSLDGGATWSFAGNGMTLYDTVASVVVDSRRPDFVWVAGFRQIYRTVNGGASWTVIRNDGAVSLIRDPAGVLYAGTLSGPMLRSADDGATWEALSKSPPTSQHLTIDPFHPQVLYSGGISGMFKSKNGGIKWFPAGRGLPAGPVSALTVDSRSGALYAAVAGENADLVFRSTDGGSKWSAVVGRLPGFTSSLAFQAGARGTLWAVSAWHPYRSLDQGRTWTALTAGLPQDGISALLPGASTLLAGTSLGPFRSADHGSSWSLSRQGMQAAGISGLALDRQQPNRLWASTYSSGVFRSTDGGDDWTLLDNAPIFLVNGPLAADPNHAGTAYLGQVGGISSTTDAGGHWSGSTLACFLPTTIAVDPLDSSGLYTTGFVGPFDLSCHPGPEACAMFYSADAGQHWTCIRDGLPGEDMLIQANFLAPDPLHPAHVYALVNAALAGQNVYVSADHGSSWSLAAAGVGIFFMVPDPSRPGTLWGGGGRDGLVRSDDGGHTWTPSGQGIPQFTLLTTLAFDPADADVLYAGTLQSGVFHSIDGGVTWEPLGDGMTGQNVRFLGVDPHDPSTLYAGTDQSGVMRLRQ